ncbi:molybdopterin synthase catalytic subunit MoaE [Pseudoalteromonas sp. S4741]|uniref:molybdopterin synthase catalytic subunit MoaE n=1 Tax=Pseudoalteromonas sp. S4741 TaxID=579563 RepID=UPI00110AE3BB|nr:molybdopterin synthase catalytic subunit MoaE [Pseudoalteromonas sp. S4741]TMO28191.1 molybdopterin synthase catalytic subunit MoaE [Pseudoalteromonas sp. S4741]
MISVQCEDFDVAKEYQALATSDQSDGAVVIFTGLVRDINQGSHVSSLHLEHYPEMTEKLLQKIVDDARTRWPLGQVRVIHRVGELHLSEQIVFVGVTSKHREAAFTACQFIMDYLKNSAPFWKKETTEQGSRWVEFNEKDKQALQRW